ncbi:MAG TPA: hypothetical protein VE591_02810, partial [Candidatus Acidoferrum sp.]|nr:hypothetical protein [Candidatus Acidoferrum sp.]
ECTLFRTASAAAAIFFTAGVIATYRQNMVGVGLVFAAPLIMLIATLLLPREARLARSEAEEDERAAAPPLGSTPPRPLPSVARYALTALIVAFTAEAIHHGALAGGALYAFPPHGAVADLSDTIDDTLPARVQVAAMPAGLALQAGDDSECPSGRDPVACEPGDRGP